MSIERLVIRGFRNLASVELAPSPGVNCLHGDNGAGKTSVVEAIHLLARGRSFRSAQITPVIRHGSDSLRVVARLQRGTTLGIERSRDQWRGRIDGRDCQRLSEFAAALPLVLIEPDSHRLVDEGPERRRQYLDWQLFHVEHDYLQSWQRYSRLLRQRNAAMKAGAEDRTVRALEAPMALAADVINQLRQNQVARLRRAMSQLGGELSFRLPGEIQLSYRSGHPQGMALVEAWDQQRASDRERGFTQRGPHRADLRLTCGGHPAAMELSRGQQKLLAVSLLLAKLAILGESASAPTVLLLDDPVSELDTQHLAELLDWLPAQAFQTWITTTAQPAQAFTLFHVEHGQVI